jgi:tetratricopeptide (TPR) repeat protein
MRRFSTLVLLCLLLGCGRDLNSNKQLIESLEQKLDSDTVNYAKKTFLADSLFKLDSNNYTGLTWKATVLFNENSIENALKYLNKSLEVREHELSSYHTLHGMCLERLGFLDSAKHHYIKSLQISPKTIFDTLALVKLETIVNGKDQGLTKLNELQDIIIELVYRTLENDVLNYQGNGLSEFEPIYERENYIAEFEIFPNDSILIDQGYNRRDMLELLYAREGINISVKFSGTSSNRMTLIVTNKYLDRVLKSDLFELKRL